MTFRLIYADSSSADFEDDEDTYSFERGGVPITDTKDRDRKIFSPSGWHRIEHPKGRTSS
jgi:hypothetical protein